jgi:glycosyltransferase involved in cell wall biosynthesis
MKIGLNAQRLVGQRLGVGRYLEYLIRHWANMLDASESVEVYLRAPLDGDAERYLGFSDAIRARVLRPRLTGSLWENLLLPPKARRLSVLFGPSYTLPLLYPGPAVVAIHSVNEALSGTHPWWYDYVDRPLYALSARKAQRVIVPSESTKVDVEKCYRVAPEKIDVVPQGADDAFRPIEDEERLRATRRKFLGADLPYILFVGKISQRRNIPMLIDAFAKLKKRRGIPHALLLVGPNHLHYPLRERCEKLGIADSVVQTDGKFREHIELVPIYNAADLFVHPSSYEGWSMTTMEALACGTAVVAVNRGGLGEVANGHALMVEEPTVDNLADAIERVLSDEPLRQELRRKARRRGSAFRWEDTTRQTLEVLRRVAAG